MIINYLDIERIAVLKAKAESPLIVDSNTPLADTILFERL